MISTKKSIFASAVALLLCFAMLLGTTFAWFTDSVTSANNIIQSGTLDVEMYWAEGTEDPSNTSWNDASKGAIFNNDKWEPGYVEVRHIKIENKGTLALQYKITIVANGEVTDLSDVIDVYYLDPAAQVVNRDQLTDNNKLGTLTEVIANLANTGTGSLAKGETDTVTLALKMQELAGNEYQNTALCDGGFSIQLLATQTTGEFDSFGDDYDNNAAADFFPGFQGGSAGVAVTTDDQRLTVGESAINAGDVSAVIPEGVKLADGANSLQLAVTLKNSSDANIQLSEAEKLGTLDVHIEGVAEGNTTPMLVTLKGYLTTGINTGALRLYHVENGATVAMTQVATPVNHNEFSYDPATGDVTLALASFSEVAVVADTNNTWNGTAATAFAGGNGTKANPYRIANADQLAYFRNEVDGGRTFDNQFVKLDANIYLSGKLFDPIGWGYVNASHNRDGVAGKVFMGTFDGNGKTIFDLYQSGWDLEEKTGTDYTYTNCGFGLFAAASGATFKNLTINGAYVRVECVEAGVLVGLSQNSCTYQNISIHNAKIANYQRPAGGLIGEVSGDGTTTITNVTIGPDVVVGSLWGDFDAPCGGVIGARWDDVGANPQIEMKYVDVSCRLDVYNDVTSAYQWHAYRRAGMLIGNTDTPAANGKVAQIATADFLECIQDDGKDTVIVRLGSWANYTYCQFTNEENPGRNYPWVRVQAGENNSAYSNPRYGHPVDANGNVVDGSGEHKHKDGDICGMTIAFAQLYGGGQGVYGATTHPGVKMENYRYSIIYVNNDAVLSIQYVTEDMAQKTKPFIPNDTIAEQAAVAWVKSQGYDNIVFDEWVTAGSKRVEIPATNTENVTVYPSFRTPYTARFVDLDGNVLDWCFFDNKNQSNIVAIQENAYKLLPPQDQTVVEFSHWEVHYYNNEGTIVTETYNSNNFANGHYTTDVTIYPVYNYAGKLNLEPVDSDGDGKTNYYKVVATAKLDETTTIPGKVLGIPVLVVEKLYENDNSWDFGSGVKTVIIEEGVEELARNSLGYTNDLTTVELPSTLTKLGKNTFSRNLWYNVFGDKDTKVLNIEYNGTKADWDKVVANSDSEWANGLKKGTTVKCTDGTYTVTSVNIETSNHKWSWTPNS